ncbi:cupin domain-containing protein [Wenxinia saemankumensis]|uniref:Cupin domain protein n=1 Tax=Wenxinia saemankumensis TaxID=1447782 RepID=A0A1M6EJ53_9RHOB|nr:cupin domain-containing protein [Wenxinia saemankumensis]SHI85439.1 Cupin domain protein [Wenxinia saemankumensis]
MSDAARIDTVQIGTGQIGTGQIGTAPPANAGIAPAPVPDAASLMQALPAAMACIANADHLPLEGGEDPAFGSVRWRTLFSADRTPTADFVLGVAEFGPAGTLAAHRHDPAEFYFGLSGSGIVTIDGIPHAIGPGIALFVPAGAEHATLAGGDGLRFLYGFARDRFSDVVYRFSAPPEAG